MINIIFWCKRPHFFGGNPKNIATRIVIDDPFLVIRKLKIWQFILFLSWLRNFRTRDTKAKKVRKTAKITWLNRAICEHRCEKSEIFATLKTPVFATFAKTKNLTMQKCRHWRQRDTWKKKCRHFTKIDGLTMRFARTMSTMSYLSTRQKQWLSTWCRHQQTAYSSAHFAASLPLQLGVAAKWGKSIRGDDTPAILAVWSV